MSGERQEFGLVAGMMRRVLNVALCLDISTPTVKRDWQFGRTWLNAELHDRRRRSRAT